MRIFQNFGKQNHHGRDHQLTVEIPISVKNKNYVVIDVDKRAILETMCLQFHAEVRYRLVFCTCDGVGFDISENK